MRPFEYVRADDAAAAVALVSADPQAEYLAGGTTELDLVLKDGVVKPGRLVDITRLPLRGITRSGLKEILESGAFTNYAADKLVLVRADFPRQKKNQLSKEQVKLNEALADKYNADGKFPFTLLIDENGKVLRSWDGFPDETPDQFIAQINSVKP